MSVTRNSIISIPNKRLRNTSKRVGVVSPEIKQLVEDMKAATLDWEHSRSHEVGVALAAIQLGKPFKVIIIRNNFDNKDDETFQVFINPEITKLEGLIEEDYEGCLSVKDIYGKVPRYSKARIKALDINGQTLRLSAEGFLARVFQHEIDHTKGLVFIDHIKDKPEAFFRLQADGHLEPLNYQKDIKDNPVLWG